MVAKLGGGVRLGSANPGTAPPRLWEGWALDEASGEQAAKTVRRDRKKRLLIIYVSRFQAIMQRR
jgi:hypothetical protein